MSGHSKWSTIKRQKEATDQQRGKIFSKLSRAIAIAAKDGIDPETNFKLRLAVEKAKQFNMPKENIARALRQAQDKLTGGGLEEMVYEGYGPDGIAVMVEAVTDNKNRTTAEIKNIFERGGGSLAGPGAVSYQFKKSGMVTVEKSKDVDKQMLTLIDLGIDDIQEATDALEVFISPEQLKEIKDKIEKGGFVVKGVELVMLPINPIQIADSQKVQRVLKFMETLEDHPDVQRVYTTF